MKDRSSIPGRVRDLFSSSPNPDRIWGPLNLMPHGYRVIFCLW